VSEGERDFVGVHEVAALVKSAREHLDHPIFLNADHSYSLERVKEAVEAGFDMVIIDDAKASVADNIVLARKVVEYVRGVNKETGRDILVEAELGYIGSSSKLLDQAPEGIKLDAEGHVDPSLLTTAEQASQFVRETGVDLFAPAVGNIHGMIKGGNPVLDIKRIADIHASVEAPLVLHGASGIKNEELAVAVKAGISMVHYNTELRVAYRDAVKKAIEDSPNEVAPYKFLASSVDAVEKVVEEKLRIMNHLA